MSKPWTIVAVLCLGVGGASTSFAEGVAPSAAGASEASSLDLVQLGDAAVAYIPARFARGERAPVLILLHGAGGRPETMVHLFSQQAEQRGVVLLGVKSRGATWDMIQELAAAVKRGDDLGDAVPVTRTDGPRIDAALQKLATCISVDGAHTAIAGFSDGASYALTIGASAPARYSSILAFSPGVAMLTQDPDPRQRVFISHGRQDRVLPFADRADNLVPALRAAGMSVTFMPFDGDHEIPPGVRAQAFEFLLGGASGAGPALAGAASARSACTPLAG